MLQPDFFHFNRPSPGAREEQCVPRALSPVPEPPLVVLSTVFCTWKAQSVPGKIPGQLSLLTLP